MNLWMNWLLNLLLNYFFVDENWFHHKCIYNLYHLPSYCNSWRLHFWLGDLPGLGESFPTQLNLIIWPDRWQGKKVNIIIYHVNISLHYVFVPIFLHLWYTCMTYLWLYNNDAITLLIKFIKDKITRIMQPYKFYNLVSVILLNNDWEIITNN